MTIEKALLRLSALCAASEQCEADLRAKMQRWLMSDPDASQVIGRLRAEGFIDDERYARAFCHDKARFNGWGRRKIAYQLATKGIGKATIGIALQEVDDDQQAQELERLLRAKARQMANRPAAQARAALLRFATSRGFEADLAYRLTAKILNDDDD